MKKIFTILGIVLVSLAAKSQWTQTVWFGTPTAPQAHSVNFFDTLKVWDSAAVRWTLIGMRQGGSANRRLLFPGNAGSSGNALTTDGAGNLSWTTFTPFSGNAADGQILFDSLSQITGSNNLYYNYSKVEVGIGSNTFGQDEAFKVSVLTDTVIASFVDSINNYCEVKIKNKSAGTNASSDLIIETNDAAIYPNDTSRYVNLGINSSGFSGLWGKAHDAYLYCDSGDVWIGTNRSSDTVHFNLGGGGRANTLAIMTSSGFDVGTTQQFQLNATGNILKLNNVVTSFPASQGGANTFLKNNGAGTLTWDNENGVGWLLNGNSGTSSATNFLGTTDAHSLVIATNGSGRETIDSIGNVTITNPVGSNFIVGGVTAGFKVGSGGNITAINNVTTSFPASQGASNTLLHNDGNGNLTWSADSAGFFVQIADSNSGTAPGYLTYNYGFTHFLPSADSNTAPGYATRNYVQTTFLPSADSNTAPGYATRNYVQTTFLSAADTNTTVASRAYVQNNYQGIISLSTPAVNTGSSFASNTLTIPKIVSGRYLPADSAAGGISSVSFDSANYTQLGTWVHVTGDFTVTASNIAAALDSFQVNVPIGTSVTTKSKNIGVITSGSSATTGNFASGGNIYGSASKKITFLFATESNNPVYATYSFDYYTQ